MIMCDICGQPIGYHRKPAVRAACHALPVDAKKTKAAQNKAISHIVKTHRPKKNRMHPSSSRFFPGRIH